MGRIERCVSLTLRQRRIFRKSLRRFGHIGDIQASADTTKRSLALRGTAGQIALAEWLFNELDQPANRPLITQEYKLPDGGDDVVRVVYLTPTDTVQEFQEVVTAVRSITDIRRMFTYHATKAVVMRGTADQVPLAEWLFNDLEKPANRQAVAQKSQNLASTTYRLAGSGDAVVRVFYLTHAGTPQRLQEVAVQVRTMTGMRRIFTYNAPRAMALHGTADQIATADRLIKERDR